MGRRIVGRVEPLTIPGVRQNSRSTIMVVAHHAPVAVLHGDLATLEVPDIAIAVTRRLAEHADMPIVVEPAQLAVVGDVAEDQEIADGVPRRALRPQDWLAVHVAVPQALDRGIALDEPAKGRIDREDVRILKID